MSWSAGVDHATGGDWGADGAVAPGGNWETGDDDAANWNNDENAHPGRGSFGGGGGGGEDGGDRDTGCRNCGAEGHYARECPEPRKPREGMNCFNCGEEGHAKADCPNPRVFKGACRLCNKEGHPASECPDRPPDVCKNCKSEGHQTMDCKENRKFDLNHIADKLPEEAWALMKKASDERDLEDFRDGLKVYSKAVPEDTFVDIEKKMRDEFFNVYLIALDRETSDCISLINLQGRLNCTYVVGFFYSAKPQRGNLRERWPASVDDNLERLEDAGLPYDRQIPKCSNCGEMGHTARGCKEERAVIERVEVKCVNCNEAGHRARDCSQPRVDRFACRNCGASDHKASECPNPRSAEGVECKRCGEMGHFAKECPQAPPARTCRNCGSEDHIAKDCDKPRDVSTVTCRNCDQLGHYTRDCQEKKDWSRVKCNNCGEMGHTVARCKASPADGGSDSFGGGDYTKNTSNDGGWNTGNGTTQAEDTPADAGGWSAGGPTGW